MCAHVLLDSPRRIPGVQAPGRTVHLNRDLGCSIKQGGHCHEWRTAHCFRAQFLDVKAEGLGPLESPIRRLRLRLRRFFFRATMLGEDSRTGREQRGKSSTKISQAPTPKPPTEPSEGKRSGFEAKERQQTLAAGLQGPGKILYGPYEETSWRSPFKIRPACLADRSRDLAYWSVANSSATDSA